MLIWTKYEKQNVKQCMEVELKHGKRIRNEIRLSVNKIWKANLNLSVEGKFETEYEKPF